MRSLLYTANLAVRNLLRQKTKNLSITALFALIVFLFSGINFISDALYQETLKAVELQPAIIVQSMNAGRQVPIDPASAARIAEIFGVADVRGRIWGYYFDPFTGANYTRQGLAEAADGGTLFLDEIGEMPAVLQAKLLRVLEDGEIRAVGSDVTRRVDVRILTATHRDLARHVAEGRFREDLYYRLNVVQLELPPLRERAEDIPLLAEHFVRLHSDAADGSGLGLTLVKSLVELNDGKVSMKSGSGQGTTVYVTLPARREDGPGVILL